MILITLILKPINSLWDCGFEYIKDGNREFLIFNTNEFFEDANALEKIRKTTGMKLVQMGTIMDIYSYGLVDICCKKI